MSTMSMSQFLLRMVCSDRDLRDLQDLVCRLRLAEISCLCGRCPPHINRVVTRSTYRPYLLHAGGVLPLP